MKRTLPFLAALSLLLSAGNAFAVLYVCDKLPMYPTGNGNCMHYAIVYDQQVGGPCQQIGVTGHADFCTSGEMCPTGCTSLGGDSGDVEFPDAYLPGSPKNVADLNDDKKCRDYLVAASPVAPGSIYDNWTFTLRGVVELKRQSTGQPFYAVVFRMEGPSIGTGPVAHIGFEILGPVPDTLVSHGIWQAMEVQPGPKLTPIPGMLKVQLDPLNQFDVAFIRIFNSRENVEANFLPDPLSVNPESLVPETTVAPGCGCNSYSYCEPCPRYSRCYRPQRWHCRPRRWRCR